MKKEDLSETLCHWLEGLLHAWIAGQTVLHLSWYSGVNDRAEENLAAEACQDSVLEYLENSGRI